MRNIVFALLFLLSVGKAVAGGYDVSVCDSLDRQGNCKGKSDIFHYPGDKMKLIVLVHNKEMLRTSKILYKLYLMKNDSEGEIAAELSNNVHPDWFATSKKLYFFKPGYYRLDVYKADNTKVSSQFITISDR